jgi:hypothetical protein
MQQDIAYKLLMEQQKLQVGSAGDTTTWVRYMFMTGRK